MKYLLTLEGEDGYLETVMISDIQVGGDELIMFAAKVLAEKYRNIATPKSLTTSEVISD